MTEEKRAYNKRYYAEHKEQFAEYGKQYRKKNREKLNAYSRRYREENKDTLQPKEKAWFKKYFEANREKVLESQRKYYYTRTPNEAFRLWMQETGTTQRALAEKVGVTQGTISMWYTGSSPVNMQKLRAALPELADYLEGAT